MTAKKQTDAQRMAALIRRYTAETIAPAEQRATDRFKGLELRLNRLERRIDFIYERMIDQ